jgi:hypothetical protein
MLEQFFEIQFGDDGLVLNTDAVTPFVDVTSISGLDNVDIRTTEAEREGMDGGFLDAQWESLRTIIIKGTAYGDESILELYMDDLKANYAAAKVAKPLYVMLPNGQRVFFCKSYTGLKYDIDQARRNGCVDFQVTLKAEDPSGYGDEVNSSVFLSTMSVLGRGYNKSFNYGYGGTGQTNGALVVNNVGNRPTPAVFLIGGGVVNPTIYHDQTDSMLKTNITLGPTDFLSIDLRSKQVILNGTASRRGVLVGKVPWFNLVTGLNSFRFGGVANGGASSLGITFRPAYR